MTFADDLAAAEHALDRQLADRYGSTAVTRDVGEPAPLDLPGIAADGAYSGAPWLNAPATVAMVAAVDAYLASKTDHERAALAVLMEAA